jgi:hypothetical protein
MKANANLTIYSKGVDPATRSEPWTRSQVLDVVWEDRRGARVSRGGEIRMDEVVVYIPFSILGSADPDLPVKVGDVIVRGLVADEIGPSFTITALKAKYTNSATVRSVDKMDRGSLHLRHYQVGAA